MTRPESIPCNKCTGTAKYTSTYTDKRRDKDYDQYYCPECRKKQTRKAVYDLIEDIAPVTPVTETVVHEKITVKDNKDGSKGLFGFVGSIDELLDTAGVDMTQWEVSSWVMTSGKWETNMNIKSGPSNNRVSKPLTVPAHKFGIKATLVPRKGIIDVDRFRRELMEDLVEYSPKVSKILREQIPKDQQHLLMLNIYDLHLDKVAWHEETGQNFDTKIAYKIAMNAVDDLIKKAKGFDIKKILFPVGHDFFNSDYSHPFPQTTGGTPQQSDLRWQDAFRKGRQLCIDIIETLKQVAEVDVVMVPGNHDKERSFYLVDALNMYYRNDENVNVSECPKVRKYYVYGDNLIGMAHGKYEKFKDLPSLMALEAKKEWSNTDYRYWKLGHLHHTKNFMTISSEEMMGVMVEYLPSLTATDAWHFEHAFVGSGRRAEADLFALKGEGRVAKLSHTVK